MSLPSGRQLTSYRSLLIANSSAKVGTIFVSALQRHARHHSQRAGYGRKHGNQYFEDFFPIYFNHVNLQFDDLQFTIYHLFTIW